MGKSGLSHKTARAYGLLAFSARAGKPGLGKTQSRGPEKRTYALRFMHALGPMPLIR